MATTMVVGDTTSMDDKTKQKCEIGDGDKVLPSQCTTTDNNNNSEEDNLSKLSSASSNKNGVNDDDNNKSDFDLELDNDDNNIEYDHIQRTGRVMAHNITATHRRHLNRHCQEFASTTSWASNEDIRRASVIMRQKQRQKQRQHHSRLPFRRTKTPTTNNLSNIGDCGGGNSGLFSEHDDDYDNSYYETEVEDDANVMEEEEAGDQHQNDGGGGKGKKEKKKNVSSFKKWLTEGLLETLNVVAGITLSTTETILSPPIAVTRKIILPGLVAIVIDALDAIVPPRVQDWFRIISSSVYHFFVVVLISGSTQHGLQFRNQFAVVVQSFLEAWSAPESRQVVVDTMATGVKLAAALNTPETELLLDQMGILGCRFVDALASGKSKELIQNSKRLILNGIELASDPSTTLALAEVTAHLCHALEEVDDSFGSVTSRSLRNVQNETTYIYPSLVTATDYQYESIEQIILSSLGMDDNNNDNNSTVSVDMDDINDDNDDDDNNDNNNNNNESVANNVSSSAALQFEGATIGSLHLEQDHESKKYGNCNGNSVDGCSKSKIDLDLLQDRILYKGNPLPLPLLLHGDSVAVTTNQHQQLPMSGLPSTNASISSNSNYKYKHNGNINTNTKEDNCLAANDNPNNNDLSEEDILKTDDMEELLTSSDRLDFKFCAASSSRKTTNPNLKELYDKFEMTETKKLEEPSYIQFYNAIDELLEIKRKEKRQNREAWVETACDDDDEEEKDFEGNNRDSGRGRRINNVNRKGIHAKVKIVRRGSKAVKEKYTNSRRRWKYPPSLLRFCAIVAIFIFLFWIGFGVYGIYTFFQVINFHKGVFKPSNVLHPVQKSPDNYGLNHGERSIASVTNANHHKYDKNTNNPNEIIIRIVKEIVHVREDGSRIESNEDVFGGSNKNNDGDPFISGFSQEEIDKMKECVASSY